MSQDPLNHLQTADLLLKVPVQVTYGLDSAGETRVKAVAVVHGPLSLDITALLTEDDFFDIFEQLHDWYSDRGPLNLFPDNAGLFGETGHD
jgi:hypothetical protein